MKRKLILHIGLHKTGSTSIQAALKKYKDKLIKNNIYPYDFNLDRSEKKICTLNEFAKIKHQDKILENITKIKQESILISAENLYHYSNKNKIQNLKKKLDNYFFKIKIIIFIRRQDKHTISYFQQRAKFNLSFGIYDKKKDFKISNFLKKDLSAYFNFNKTLKAWEDVFGTDNLTVKSFEKNDLYLNNLIKDFFNNLDIDVPIQDAQIKNPSNGLVKTKILFLMNKNNISHDSSIRKTIAKNIDNSGKMLPSKKQAQEFYEKYRESNRLLNERFKISKNPYIFDDNFSMYPDVANDTWNEENANQAILNILTGVKEYSQTKENKIKFLKQKIAILENKNPYITRAKFIKDNLIENIKNKLKKYPSIVKLKRKILD